MALTALSILIADDNEMNRWLLAEQMQYWCDDIDLACNGWEAWEMLQKKYYSLVFIDVNMPVMNGCELIKKARAHPNYPSVPMIAITAHVQVHHRHLLIADGFNECLIKPIVLADLQRVISQWCMPANQSSGDYDYYAQALLQKVEHNRELGRVFLRKLFAEVPGQLAGLEQTLQNHQCLQASDLAHKLHGTFCFYGFEDFRMLACSIERYLLEADIANAALQFQLLAEKFQNLEDMKADVESRLV
ncbi:MAG: response regulator [Methylomonas sp.]|nr:response regulator [Methylomonas sp.]